MPKSSSASMKASDLFIQALENEGVEYIFAVPGEENLDFIESLRNSNIKLVLNRHEQSAGFMAATYGRLTGKPGVCLSTLGPGATNLVTAAAYAKLGGMPMVMLTGQKPIMMSKQGHFQIIDVVSMMRPLTKYAKQIVNAGTIPSLVRESFRIAEEERPGPVHLELPEDIAATKTDQTYIFPVRTPERSIASVRAVADAANMIENAKRPLLLIGAGANRKRVITACNAFLDNTGIPFFNTQMGKGVIGGYHKQYIGTAALSSGDYLHCAIERADLVINVGHDIIEKPPFLMEPDEGCDGKKVIHINFVPASVDEVYFPQLEVIGDIGDTLKRLSEKLKKNPDHDFDYFYQIRKEVLQHISEDNENENFPLVPQRIVADVQSVMTDNGIIALDNGMYKIWFARNYRAKCPNSVLLDNALATMGAGLPSAMMAAMLNPKLNVMAICGDGGFMMNSQELETAIRLKLNLVVLVLRDDSYGMIRWKQAINDMPDWGLEFGNPDFVDYANSYGATGHRVTKTTEFKPLMESCFKTGGVHLIEVPIDYSENERVLIKELAERVCLL